MEMELALQSINAAVVQERSPGPPFELLPVPWRDPQTVSPEQLTEYISYLEKARDEHPRSADLYTCLGIAHAMNYDVYKSVDALEKARDLDATHFFAQLKYAELFYRLRALPRAEQEALAAVNLAKSNWELGLARKQLSDIRSLSRTAIQRPAWTKPLVQPALVLLILLVLASVAMVASR